MDKVSEILQLCLYKRRPSSRTFDLAPSTDAPPPPRAPRAGRWRGGVGALHRQPSRAPSQHKSHFTPRQSSHDTAAHIIDTQLNSIAHVKQKHDSRDVTQVVYKWATHRHSTHDNTIVQSRHTSTQSKLSHSQRSQHSHSHSRTQSYCQYTHIRVNAVHVARRRQSTSKRWRRPPLAAPLRRRAIMCIALRIRVHLLCPYVLAPNCRKRRAYHDP